MVEIRKVKDYKTDDGKVKLQVCAEGERFSVTYYLNGKRSNYTIMPNEYKTTLLCEDYIGRYNRKHAKNELKNQN